jgi:hypothetical protein
MALFPMSGVLRGIPPAAYAMYASAKTLACPAIALFQATADAALLIKKIAHFRIRHFKMLTYSLVCCAFSSVRALSLNVIYILEMVCSAHSEMEDSSDFTVCFAHHAFHANVEINIDNLVDSKRGLSRCSPLYFYNTPVFNGIHYWHEN